MQKVPKATRGISLPREMDDKLKRLADERDVPKSWIIKEALKKYFEDLEQQPRVTA